MPQTLERMPLLSDGEAAYFTAFCELALSRNFNGTIPLTEIAAWLDLHGIDDADERIEWTAVIRGMDEEMAAWREQQKPRQPDGERRSPPG